MKLLFCPACHDTFGLRAEQWRRCVCGASGGQYNRDKETATIGGKARVFGIGNPFFFPTWLAKTEDERQALRASYYQRDQDCWWGESPDTPGDVQLFRIPDAAGPRLRIKILYYPDRLGSTKVIQIIDKREFTVDGRVLHEVTMPGRRGASKKFPFYKRWLFRAFERWIYGR